MTHAQALDTVERTRLLVDYVEAWRTAHNQYRAWRSGEWQSRRAKYRTHERVARRALIELLRTLSYDARGRVRNDSRDARKRLKAFRKDSDQVFARLLQAGRRLFGVAPGLKPDPKTGLYTGSPTPELLDAAKENLGRLMSTVREGIERA